MVYYSSFWTCLLKEAPWNRNPWNMNTLKEISEMHPLAYDSQSPSNEHKAQFLLFLGNRSVVPACQHTQDIRKTFAHSLLCSASELKFGFCS